jgi:hypothetical protein
MFKRKNKKAEQKEANKEEEGGTRLERLLRKPGKSVATPFSLANP